MKDQKYSSLLDNIFIQTIDSAMTPSRIKTIRGKYRLTQLDFADLLMVKYETYRKWEQGVRFPSSPGYAVLVIAEKHPKIFLENRKEIIKRAKESYL